MSTTRSNLENEFTKVSYKRKGKTKTQTEINRVNDTSNDSDLFDLNFNIRRISQAKEELLTTDLYQSVSALLKEGLTHLSNPKIANIICLGLGRISESAVPRYQLALLLCLRELIDVDIKASDPIFNNNDIALLKHFGVAIENNNVEGKHKVNLDTILFYLPHCPKQLTNNLLWSNWGLHLSKCIVMCNSINKVIEDNCKKDLSKFARYINSIGPYVLELGIVNSFKFFEVFNDTSIHFFPLDKLSLLPADFWEGGKEPEYCDSDIEFIRKSVENKLIIDYFRCFSHTQLSI